MWELHFTGVGWYGTNLIYFIYYIKLQKNIIFACGLILSLFDLIYEVVNCFVTSKNSNKYNHNYKVTH